MGRIESIICSMCNNEDAQKLDRKGDTWRCWACGHSWIPMELTRTPNGGMVAVPEK